MMQRRAITLCTLLATLWSLPAVAAAPNMAAKVRAYAERHGLPVREVPIDLPGRKTSRLFVPVTDESAADFVREFAADDSLILRQTTADKEHSQLYFRPNDVIGMNALRGTVPSHADALHGGLYLALGLDPEHKAFYRENASTQTPGQHHGGCMWWLVGAKVAAQERLAHAIGVRQSKAPSNLVKKAVHAGNAQVVVGVSLSERALHPEILRLSHQIAGITNALGTAKAQLEALHKLPTDRESLFAAHLAPFEARVTDYEARLAPYRSMPQYASSLASWDAQMSQYRAQLEAARTTYREPFDIRLEQLTTQLAQLAEAVATYPQAQFQGHRDAWLAQAAPLEAERVEMLAVGREAFHPYEPQMRAQRQALQQYRAQLEPFERQLATLQAAKSAGQRDVHSRFAALSDEDLMGPPPGGGAAEAVH